MVSDGTMFLGLQFNLLPTQPEPARYQKTGTKTTS